MTPPVSLVSLPMLSAANSKLSQCSHTNSNAITSILFFFVHHAHNQQGHLSFPPANDNDKITKQTAVSASLINIDQFRGKMTDLAHRSRKDKAWEQQV